MSQDSDERKSVNVQLQVNPNYPGNLMVLLDQCPIIEVNGELKPAFLVPINNAMILGMNIIYLAKLEENRLANMMMLSGIQQSQEDAEAPDCGLCSGDKLYLNAICPRCGGTGKVKAK